MIETEMDGRRYAGPTTGFWEVGSQNLLLSLRWVLGGALLTALSLHPSSVPELMVLDVSGEVAEGRHGPQP